MLEVSLNLKLVSGPLTQCVVLHLRRLNGCLHQEARLKMTQEEKVFASNLIVYKYDVCILGK